MKTFWLTSLLIISISLLTQVPMSAQPPEKGKLQHVVNFKFKASAQPEQIDELVKAFAALPKNVKEIKGFEWGTNNSPENLNKGFTHCFIVTFNTAEDRDAYLVHAAHKEFVKLVGPIVDDVFVIDFWSKK